MLKAGTAKFLNPNIVFNITALMSEMISANEDLIMCRGKIMRAGSPMDPTKNAKAASMPTYETKSVGHLTAFA